MIAPVLASALLISGAVSSTASTAQIDSIEDVEFRQYLSEAGVDEAGIDSVLTKLRQGEGLDSSSGAAPTHTTVTVEVEDGLTFEVTTDHFADGSFNRSKMELPQEVAPGAVSAMSITQCRNSTSGSYIVRTNCLIEWDNPYLGLNFRANYRYLPGPAGSGTINDVYNYNFWAVAGVATGGSLTIPVTTGNPARATATVTYASVGGVTGGQDAVSLHVDQSGARLFN